MNKENCVLKLVDEIILYYDARSKKHQNSNVLFGIRCRTTPPTQDQIHFKLIPTPVTVDAPLKVSCYAILKYVHLTVYRRKISHEMCVWWKWSDCWQEATATKFIWTLVPLMALHRLSLMALHRLCHLWHCIACSTHGTASLVSLHGTASLVSLMALYRLCHLWHCITCVTYGTVSLLIAKSACLWLLHTLP